MMIKACLNFQQEADHAQTPNNALNYTLSLKPQSPASMDGSLKDGIHESCWRKTIIYINTEYLGLARTGFFPAPPPKRHFSTFWRSVTKGFTASALRKERKWRETLTCVKENCVSILLNIKRDG
jgi:hypothetical protein